jgi:hypothetical protein
LISNELSKYRNTIALLESSTRLRDFLGAEGRKLLSIELQDTRTTSVLAVARPPRFHWGSFLQPAKEGLWYGEGAVVQHYSQDAHVRGIKVLLHPPRCLAPCGVCFHHHYDTVRPTAE